MSPWRKRARAEGVEDALCAQRPERADREYVRLLHLAATTSEADVEAALTGLLDSRTLPTFDAVRALVRSPQIPIAPQLHAPPLDLAVYDQLLPTQRKATTPAGYANG